MAHPAAERGVHAADFAEYPYLYQRAWTELDGVRKLLAQVPTFLMFDDHEATDDWNCGRRVGADAAQPEGRLPDVAQDADRRAGRLLGVSGVGQQGAVAVERRPTRARRRSPTRGARARTPCRNCAALIQRRLLHAGPDEGSERRATRPG